MKKVIRTFICLSALFGSTSAMAQGDSLEMDLTIVGDLDLFLRDAKKLQTSPELRESLVELPSISYTLIPNKQQVEIVTNPIKPAKVTVEPPISKLYKGYVKAGFGVYRTPLLDLYYMDDRSRDGSWGIQLHHLSSSGGTAFEDTIPDGFSHNSASIWGRKYLKKHSIQGALDYNRDVVNYFGFDPQIYWDTPTDNLEQTFSNVQGNLELKSYHRDSSKFNYAGEVAFRNFQDARKGIENNVNFDFNGRKYKDNELYSLDVGINYNNFQYLRLTDGDKLNQDNVIIRIQPMASTRAKNFLVKFGMSLIVDTQSDSPIHVYPIAEAAYSLLDDLFIPYVGVRGDLQQNTYRSVTTSNPFVLTDIELNNTNQKLQAYGGIRGTLSSSTSFNVSSSFTKYEDFMYFVNDSAFSSGNQFSVLYDELSVFQLKGELSVNTNDNFRFQLSGEYNLYEPDFEAYAWYQPVTRFTLTSSYNLQDKLIVRMDLFSEGRRKAKSVAQVREGVLENDGSFTVDLKAYLDANLGIEYRYTKRLSAFVQLNNFLAAKYQRLNQYNIQRFNAMMGATYSF